MWSELPIKCKTEQKFLHAFLESEWTVKWELCSRWLPTQLEKQHVPTLLIP
jgi:hypothetical protein